MFVDEMVLQCGSAMNSGQCHHAVGKPPVDPAGRIFKALVLNERRHIKQAEDLDRAAIGRRNQVAADHQDQKNDIKPPVHEVRGAALERAQFGVFGLHIDSAPRQPRQQHNQKHQSNAAVKVGSGLIVGAIIRQIDHPPAQPEHGENCKRHEPVKGPAHGAISCRSVLDRHRDNPGGCENRFAGYRG